MITAGLLSHEAEIAILEGQQTIMLALASMHPNLLVGKELVDAAALAALQVKRLRGTFSLEDIQKFEEAHSRRDG